jgi:hypothetical protein
VLTYRADGAFLADPQPLELAGDGILSLGGAEGRRTVAFVADEPRTLPPLAAYLRRALQPGAPHPEPVAPPVGSQPGPRPVAAAPSPTAGSAPVAAPSPAPPTRTTTTTTTTTRPAERSAAR